MQAARGKAARLILVPLTIPSKRSERAQQIQGNYSTVVLPLFSDTTPTTKNRATSDSYGARNHERVVASFRLQN